MSAEHYYHDGNASVTYLVPKKTEDNIFELTKDANIFEEKEDEVIWHVRQENIKAAMETEVHCLKKDMLFIFNG